MNNWVIAGYTCSDHAQKRMQQRGIRKESVEAVLMHGDKRSHQGGDAVAIFVSNRVGRQLVRDRVITHALLERLVNLVVLTAEDIIVTTFPRKGGRLRRGEPA